MRRALSGVSPSPPPPSHRRRADTAPAASTSIQRRSCVEWMRAWWRQGQSRPQSEEGRLPPLKTARNRRGNVLGVDIPSNRQHEHELFQPTKSAEPDISRTTAARIRAAFVFVLDDRQIDASRTFSDQIVTTFINRSMGANDLAAMSSRAAGRISVRRSRQQDAAAQSREQLHGPEARARSIAGFSVVGDLGWDYEGVSASHCPRCGHVDGRHARTHRHVFVRGGSPPPTIRCKPQRSDDSRRRALDPFRRDTGQRHHQHDRSRGLRVRGTTSIGGRRAPQAARATMRSAQGWQARTHVPRKSIASI